MVVGNQSFSESGGVLVVHRCRITGERVAQAVYISPVMQQDLVERLVVCGTELVVGLSVCQSVSNNIGYGVQGVLIQSLPEDTP